MAMKIETVWAAMDSLLDYAKNCELLHPLDETFARNSLLAELKLESYEKQKEHYEFPECLNILCDYAAENGQIRIDEIEAGDRVWAYDIFTGETALKEVTKVYVHEVDEILHLHTTAGDIDTTTNHPFFVIDRGWVAAGDLVEGDEVYLIDGSTAFVTGAELEKLAEPIKVYNLEVADFNTYFVGDNAVLVHNYKKVMQTKAELTEMLVLMVAKFTICQRIV